MLLTQELENLSNNLRNKTDENRALQLEIDKFKRTQGDIDYEFNRLQTQIQSSETRIRKLETENDELKRRIQENDLEVSRKFN